MKNYSRQREEIIDVIKKSNRHMTAEEIYMIAKGMDPAISRSTVYRNLALLVENKVISKISMKIGPDKYDYIKNMHNHVICIKCGNIFDFDYNFNYDELKKIIHEQTNIEISEAGITIEGICDFCKK